MEIVFSILILIYAIFTIALYWHWVKMQTFIQTKISQLDIFVTVVIPVRNEELNLPNLLQDLEKQTYKNFEIIVVNDHSEDKTIDVVNEYVKKSLLNIKILSLPDGIYQKKQALKYAIAEAKGELIVCTDGDCRVQSKWLENFVNFQAETEAYFISAPVCFHEGTLFDNLQIVEFSSLISTGAVSMEMGKPNMCNGANLAYSKEAYEKVKGFEGTEEIASGDDELLMHKIHRQFPNKVRFLKSISSVVTTSAQPTLKSFFNQRKRWASKWEHYKNIQVKLLALGVFSFHLFFCIALILSFLGKYILVIFAIQFSIKFICEFVFLRNVLEFFGKRHLSYLIAPLTVLHPFYVVLFGLVARFGKFEWKGRKVQ